MSEKQKNELTWINPIGGLGDTLMLSGVLKLLNEQDPSKKFNLVRRKGYTSFLKGHPAINEIGYPPRDAKFIKNDYWSHEELGGGTQRAFQILARTFGLKTPVEEKLYFPGIINEDDLLFKLIPWKKLNVIISPSSESPRKEFHPMIWHQVVEKLIAKDINVMQVGRDRELHIHNTYSINGLTTPGELFALIKKVDLVITVDNFVMHAAQLVEKPAIALWGPTSSLVYGYQSHTHIHAPMDHCNFKTQCLGPKFSQNYSKPCPLEQEHCMNKISPEIIYNSALKILT
jgi:ADP-heptose:LPS heptosyltransferase